MNIDPALLQRIVEHAESASATMRHALAHAGFFSALGISFLAGLAFNFNPVSLAVMPTSLVYVTKARKTRQVLALGGMLIAGFLLAHVLLGAAAGLGGLEVKRLIGRFWGIVLGPLLILLGLVWPGWVRIPFLTPVFCGTSPETSIRPTSLWGAFGMGLVFSVAVCPFCTPALVVLLGAAAGMASPGYGMALLLAFAVGRAVPIIAGLGAIGWLERIQTLTRYRHGFEVAGGITLILMGLYMLNAFFFFI
ncbi:MAG: cytochrome c biogenesis protein CcdA, partial [Nitrospirota bacterium]|nr:cytochrome c biogenesis protein CcdA [Nitrospirota bacterium]